MCGVLIGLWADYYVRLGQWLTGITGSVRCNVVPVLDCHSGGMFELVIVRMELVVMSSGLASEVTLCQSGFHFHVCYVIVRPQPDQYTAHNGYTSQHQATLGVSS